MVSTDEEVVPRKLNITYNTNTTQNTTITVPRIYTKTVTIVTKLLGTFFVILTLTIQEDVTALSPFFKAAVSFTINIPIWDNSCLVRTTLCC